MRGEKRGEGRGVQGLVEARTHVDTNASQRKLDFRSGIEQTEKKDSPRVRGLRVRRGGGGEEVHAGR